MLRPVRFQQITSYFFLQTLALTLSAPGPVYHHSPLNDCGTFCPSQLWDGQKNKIIRQFRQSISKGAVGDWGGMSLHFRLRIVFKVSTPTSAASLTVLL